MTGAPAAQMNDRPSFAGQPAPVIPPKAARHLPAGRHPSFREGDPLAEGDLGRAIGSPRAPKGSGRDLLSFRPFVLLSSGPDFGGEKPPPRSGRSTKGQQDTRTKGRAPLAEGTRGRAIRPPRPPKDTGARPVVLSSFRPVVERPDFGGSRPRDPAGRRNRQCRRSRDSGVSGFRASAGWRTRNRRCEADGVASALRHVSAFSRTRRSGRTRRCWSRFAKRAVLRREHELLSESINRLSQCRTSVFRHRQYPNTANRSDDLRKA